MMVKKSLLLALLSTFAFLSLSAQDEFKKEWNIGAGFGVNLSQADFATSSSTSPFKTTMWQQYQGGLAMRFLTEKNLGLIVELNYSQQGWEQNFKDDKNPLYETIKDFEHTHQLNYLEVPFLTHIYFGNKVRFFINLGPKIGILLSEKESMNTQLTNYLASGDTPASFVTSQYHKKADRKFDYGIMVGMGLEFRTGIGHFALEGRYTFGLADFYGNSKSDHFQRSANRVIGAKLTYYTKIF